MKRKKIIRGYQVRDKNDLALRFWSHTPNDAIANCPDGSVVVSTYMQTYGISLRFFWMKPYKPIGYNKYPGVVNIFHLHIGFELLQREAPLEIVYDPEELPDVKVDEL